MQVIRVFAGMQPAIASRLLEPPHATDAVNCLLDNGDLRPLEGSAPINPQPVVQANAKTLFLYNYNQWFSFAQPTSVVRSPIRQDQYDRVYLCDGSSPRFTSNLVSNGAGVLPANTYRLGVPAPTDAPIPSYTAADPTNADPLDDDTRFYVYTYVNEFGEESAPSPLSAKVVVEDPEQYSVELALATLTLNDYNLTHVNIYRSATAGTDSGFFFIGQVNYGDVSFTDTQDVLTGPLLATQDFDVPPQDMHALIMLKNGIMVGASGHTVCPSQAYLPYAYRPQDQLVANAPIVAMAALPNGAVVATEAYPELLTGYTPDALELDKLELEQSCVSARSMVDMGQQVMYASPDGLVSVSLQGAALITDGVILPEQWRTYVPSSMHAYQHEGQYIVFYDKGNGERGGLVFDPSRKDLLKLGFYASAGYRDLTTDRLYLLIDDVVCEYRQGSALTLTWRSKTFVTPPSQYLVYRIKHQPGSDLTQTTVVITTDCGEIVRDTLTDRDWDYIPAGLHTHWHIEVNTNQTIEAVMLGQDIAQLGV